MQSECLKSTVLLSHLHPTLWTPPQATNTRQSSCNNATYFWNIKTPTITINEMRSDVIQIRWYSSGGWKTKKTEACPKSSALYNHGAITRRESYHQGIKKSTELRGSHINHNIYDISNANLSPKMTLSGKNRNKNNFKLCLLSRAGISSELCGLRVSYRSCTSRWGWDAVWKYKSVGKHRNTCTLHKTCRVHSEC